MREGIKELFDEIFPVFDYTGEEMKLEFLISEEVLQAPRFSEDYARENNLSYEAPFRIRVRLTNQKTKEVKEQEVYLGDFPIMTDRGTFIVNGVERVVISQLIRSSGVYFTLNYWRGRKLFGAKIIPNRGAWLEFETDTQGALWVKVDRKRKIAVTTFLKALGWEDMDELKQRLSDVDKGAVSYIEHTLSAGQTKTKQEALIEVYKRIRPGDLATVDNAQELVASMFSQERYDLARVGRYKFNRRLGIPDNRKRSLHSGVLDLEDILAVIREIILLNTNPLAVEDDIDHLGNRRVRGVGELIQSRLRVGLTRMVRIIKDRMSTLDPYTLTPAQLINARPFIASVKEFFTSSQLSQFMDQVNPLAELEHKRRMSAMGPGGLTRERAGFEVRDVHPSHYGRICPVQTPEGANIGLIGYLASYARINDFGLMETPYLKVKDVRITSELVWLDAAEEGRYIIAQAGVDSDAKGFIKDNLVAARIKGQAGVAEKEEINLIGIAPQQIVSIATNLIPFLEHDDANRAMMGSNMQRQAVGSLRPQAPRVGTGMEEAAARDSGRLIIAEESGVVEEADARHIVVRYGGRRKEYRLSTFTRSNASAAIHQRAQVRPGQPVKKGDVLTDSSSTENGNLALGQNLLVAFLSWGGANFEDAVILSERLVKDDRFTSIHIDSHSIPVRDTKLGPEITTHDIPNIGEERLKDLDEEGIVRIGAEVRSNDILVGKVTPKGEADLTPEERLLRAIFGEKAKEVKDTSLKLPHGKRGRVVNIRVFSREKGDKLESGVIKEIHVDVAQLRRVSVGDKLAGRHGNKGVISKVLPEEDMPFLSDGMPVDIILNPLGVASRMNIGQILETHLGWAADKLGYYAVTPALAGVTEQEIKEELKKAGLPENGKVQLYDGRTGESFNQKSTVGVVYMMKLHHLVEDKIHMRSIGPYSLITQQPLGGKAQFGGQRFGEMEVWALEGYGAAHTLQEMLTIKSDDVVGRSNAFNAIIHGEKIKSPHIPASFQVLLSELRGLALSVELRGKQEERLEFPTLVQTEKVSGEPQKTYEEATQ